MSMNPHANHPDPLVRQRFDVDGVVNFRDVGGYRTEDGRTVRWRRVFRSGHFAALSDAGLEALEALGVRVVVDLRGPFEVDRDPSRLPSSTRRIPLPLWNPVDDEVDTLGAAIMSEDPAVQRELLGDGKAMTQLLEGNRRMPETAAAEFATFLRVLAGDDGLPAVVHCTAGKDRTGLAIAVLLRTLGVPAETVMEDYLLSNPFRADANELLLASAGRRMAEPELLRPMLEVREEYLLGSFETIAAIGGFDRYRREVLEIDEDVVDALRERLLDDPS